MIKATSISLQHRFIPGRQIAFAFLAISYVLLIVKGWSGYFVWSSPLSWTGLIGFLFLIYTNEGGRNKVSTRYFFPTMCVVGLSFLLPVKTFLYFSIVLGVLLMVESLIAKGNYLSIFLFIVISPIFNYFTTVFTFPIRLKLSWLAAKFLSFINPSIKQAGNIIETGNGDFSVEAECLGLNMVSMGLLTGILLLGYYQLRTKSVVNLFRTFCFLSAVFILILVSNFFRIICLVQFNIPAGTTLHELIGLVCLLVYVMLPATFFIQRKLAHSKPVQTILRVETLFVKGIIVKNFIVCISLFLSIAYVKEQRKLLRNTGNIALPAMAGYNAEMIDKDIVKLEKTGVLIYIKHVMGFYSTEHSPMICWAGSGYELKRIQHQSIAGIELYTAKLVKGDEILYTCWWFDNGDYRTISQLNWRWKNMRGSPDFSIVNITASSEAQMTAEVERLINSGDLKDLLIR